VRHIPRLHFPFSLLPFSSDLIRTFTTTSATYAPSFRSFSFHELLTIPLSIPSESEKYHVIFRDITILKRLLKQRSTFQEIHWSIIVHGSKYRSYYPPFLSSWKLKCGGYYLSVNSSVNLSISNLISILASNSIINFSVNLSIYFSINFNNKSTGLQDPPSSQILISRIYCWCISTNGTELFELFNFYY